MAEASFPKLPDAENIFGKRHGRHDEAAAHDAIEEIVKRTAWGFAALPLEAKLRAMEKFNEMHNHPHMQPRFEIVRRP
jgi:hypothetical protein